MVLAASFTSAGGLLSYGPKPDQADASAAVLVDKILGISSSGFVSVRLRFTHPGWLTAGSGSWS